ncbi:LINE-1 retrotransposable element ORF2 protein [Merluccius polli]|uniref:LINE-1 retrotransposable element ORF2 protein n=1 Tax=Merluccius polli TaxID=89951 RepID=A0AA47MYQ7_MERPO|nr:LINE-1 retrotransposable element ORF2 protein [Merluccius polli]
MYTAGDEHTLSVTEHNVRRALSCVNTRKAAGPDGMCGRVLKTCANQLAPVFTTIFNLSLAKSVVPTCFKRSTIVPVPKNASPACLNDYRPVALTSVVMKCFERLIKHYICASEHPPVCLDHGLSNRQAPGGQGGIPQGCVLSPVLYSLYTHDYVARSSSNSIIKFADDTVVVGLISDNDEKAYLEDDSLFMNVTKTKEMIVYFRRAQQPRMYTPLWNNGTTVDRVSSFSGVHITEDLTWNTHIDTLVKARQRLYHLRQLRKFRVSMRILQSFYSGAVESILTGNITAWFGNSTAQDRRALQRVVRSAERTTGITLPSLQD